MNKSLNPNSSQESKNNASEAVFEKLSDYLFDNVNLISGTFATATATTSTTVFSMGLRVIDTSVRQFMRPDRKIRFRCSFYITNPSKALAYIFVPATIDTQTTPSDLSGLTTYIGLKIGSGVVSLVAKDSSGERTVTTNQLIELDPLISATFSKTYYLEIRYDVTSISVYINGSYIGTIGWSTKDNIYTYQTFYPLISPVVSTDGTSANITMESYQILQDK